LAQSVVSLGVIERWSHFLPHLSTATTLPWEVTEHKNDKFRRKQHIVLWINNVLRHAWLLEASAESARHRSNTGRSPSP